MSCMTILFSKFANQQIRHQATHNVGCQPGDCIWSFLFKKFKKRGEGGSNGYVWANILTLSPPKVHLLSTHIIPFTVNTFCHDYSRRLITIAKYKLLLLTGDSSMV